MEQLTAALVARGRDIQALETQITELRAKKDDCDLLKAQVDLYKLVFVYCSNVLLYVFL